MDGERVDVVIEALVASPIHSYEGRPADGPRPTSGDSRESLEIRTGLGVVGDRYFGRAAHRAANPCAWMDVVYAPGAFRELRGRGGMRCSPLTDGVLRLGPAVLLLHPRADA